MDLSAMWAKAQGERELPEPAASPNGLGAWAHLKFYTAYQMRAAMTPDPAALQRFAEAVLAAQWRPIEAAPQDGTEILGWRRGRVATAFRTPRPDCEMWSFGDESGAFEHWPEVRPTHWMPHPPAPSGAM